MSGKQKGARFTASELIIRARKPSRHESPPAPALTSAQVSEPVPPPPGAAAAVETRKDPRPIRASELPAAAPEPGDVNEAAARQPEAAAATTREAWASIPPPERPRVPTSGIHEDPTSGDQIAIEMTPRGGFVDRMDRVGKASGWVIQSIIAVCAFAIAVFTLNLNRQNYVFQNQNIAINAVRSLVAEFTNENQRYGNYCIHVAMKLHELDRLGGEFGTWVGEPGTPFPDYILNTADPKVISLIERCMPDPSLRTKFATDRVEADRFSDHARRQIGNHLNSYETYLKMIELGLGDTKVLCGEASDYEEGSVVDFMRHLTKANPHEAQAYRALCSFANKGFVLQQCHKAPAEVGIFDLVFAHEAAKPPPATPAQPCP